MKILITANDHFHYDRTGDITAQQNDGRYVVRIPGKLGSIYTVVAEGEFKPVKQQDDKKSKVDPAGTLSKSGKRQADGLGCVERVSSVERDWDDPAAHNPRGY